MENKQEATPENDYVKRLMDMDPGDIQEAGKIAFFGILKKAKAEDKDHGDVLKEVSSDTVKWMLGRIIDIVGQVKGISFDKAKEYVLQAGLTDAIKDNEQALDLFLHNAQFVKAINDAAVDFDKKVAEGVKAHLEKLE